MSWTRTHYAGETYYVQEVCHAHGAHSVHMEYYAHTCTVGARARYSCYAMHMQQLQLIMSEDCIRRNGIYGLHTGDFGGG